MTAGAQKVYVYVLSDSLGETAEYVVRAAVSQFDYEAIDIRRIPFVDDVSTIDEVLASAKENEALIIYTLVVPELVAHLRRECERLGLTAIDLMTPLLESIGARLGQAPKYKPGLVHKLDEDYFKRVEAIEFAVKYDDGKDPRGILRADIVLVGVSRTSKTPLSMYLAHRRMKVANVPLVPEVTPPKELFQISANKIVGLSIDPEVLHHIRTERLKSLGLGLSASYASLERILEELEYAENLMKRLGCPVINVTNKAVEETAGIILQMIKGGTHPMKYVYHFHEGDRTMKALLGGKGANLAEMTRAGLPVPPGFTITTEACKAYYAEGRTLPEALVAEVDEAVRALEAKTKKRFGDPERPLLVSVRSGAAISMPGMMDTILNLGINDAVAEGLSRLTGDARFAYDAYRRFIQMFGDVVLGIDHYRFEAVIEARKKARGVQADPELSADDWRAVIAEFLSVIEKETRRPFPTDPREQLYLAVRAVFDSWNNQRAIVYRKIHKIPDDLGTAVNVQSMVFGNMGETSGTGVAFTRNPSTGENALYGEFLLNAQGEDVVAGIRTPQPIARLKDIMPEVYAEFEAIARRLEAHYRDMQDIEWTIERGKLYLLQTRSGKRTAQAAVRIAVDMVREGLIDEREAVLRVSPEMLDQLLHRRIDPAAELDVLAKGLSASPGAATGRVVFDADEAEARGKRGEAVILVRPETTPDDIHGIALAQGVITSRGGMTSHAAVVARGMGKPAIVGAEAIKIDLERECFSVGDAVVRKGDVLSMDGASGLILRGAVPLVEPEPDEAFRTLLGWADAIRRLDVRANADTPEDAARARAFGAQGIGLCRTEHMFMAAERLPVVREMILAQSPEERAAALERLRPMQEEDFYGIFKAMAPHPVTIRLLDPPLHEFLPNYEELLLDVDRLSRDPSADPTALEAKRELLKKVRALKEENPMLGLRGCRLGLLYPEIYAMQAEAIFRAAFRLQREGAAAKVEIMIPLVGHVNELKAMRAVVDGVYRRVADDFGAELEYAVGTMIEVPRAALTADEIAEVADFFSFGTNDLTQTTFGYSRDDAEGKFLHHYIEHKILSDNPFAVLDAAGVGKLVEMGTRLGRQANAKLKVGVCGEHGGEAQSIAFFHSAGLDYVSASPYRVPLARLAAAQAAAKTREAEAPAQII